MSWYYVDNSGQTQGGFEVSVMKQKYASKELTEESYVWNGTSVNQWTPLKGVDELLKQVKPSAPASSAPSRRPARRNPFGGGGRADFLKSIQRGTSLKKVEPKKEEDKPAPKSGGGGGGGGGGMDLMAQLRAKQNAMKKKGTIGGSKAGGGAKTGGPRPSGAKKTWGTKSTTSSTGPKKTWGSKNSSTNVTKSSYSSGGGGGGGGSSSARITKIKSKLDSAEDWQLRAIEKILQ